MPALNYSSQFAPLVESGRKTQTIRALRKRPIKTGDKLYHYTGMRTKACRALGWSICSAVIDIDIFYDYLPQGNRDKIPSAVFFNSRTKGSRSRELQPYEVWALALEDGFLSVKAFYKWFVPVGDFHFMGQLIKWEGIQPC